MFTTPAPLPSMVVPFSLNSWGSWFFLLALVDLVLKGMALWKSARRGEKWWFIFLLLINSAGILPGIYLLTHQEQKSVSKKKK